MTSHVNVSGVWKDLPEIHVNVSGTWKECDTVHVNVGGTWKEVHAKAVVGTPPVVANVWSAGTANNDSVSVTSMSGISSGDLLVCVASTGDIPKNISIPTGFTLGNETDVADGTLAWFWKIADGTETSVVVQIGTPKCACQVHVLHVTGNHASPIDVSSANSGSGTSSTATSITTTVANTLLLHMTTVIDPSLPTHTAPSGYTEEADIYQDSSQNWTACAVSSDTQAAAGATGTVTGTWTQTGNFVASLLAIKPS